MSAESNDIAIVDLDLPKTTWSRVHSSMRTLHLKLSREPDAVWRRFFMEERESRIVLKRHGLWLEDDYIVFDCLLEDVEAHHLPDFRLSVDYANRKYAEWLAARREAGEQRRVEVRSEEDELAALRKLVLGADPPRALAPAPQPLPPKPIETMAALEAPPSPPAALEAPPSPPAAPAQPSERAPAPAEPPASNNEIADFATKRDELRARFRAALASRNKESASGND
ncbi:MAG TPA: hypothetical protein VFB32_01620 [Rudaea sp.]|nr:hypothetical protein [Rudaea sp.]